MKYVWIFIVIAVIIGIIVWAKKAPGEIVQENTTQKETVPKEEESLLISNKRVQNGMTIETTKEGNGVAITNGQIAVVQYEGKLQDGSVFDSTAKRNNTPFEFPLGAGRVIKGWDQGVLGMKVGETRVLTIPPELGYGAAGYPPVIPQNATLIFTVTLEAIK